MLAGGSSARVLREPLEVGLSKGLSRGSGAFLCGPRNCSGPFVHEVLYACPTALVEGKSGH
jgi:hypothetical protein